MNLSEYASYDGLALAELVKRGEVSRREVYKVSCEAIDGLNKSLNFIAHSTPNEAERILNSNHCHEGTARFLGVPFLMKEGAVKGEPSDMGSRLNVGNIALEDSEITKRFRRTGVTIVGLSTLPEGGNSPTTESVLYGPTRNPWNTDYMVGGSSGGAAAAVACGAVPIAHASDGGGSIRTPASCCGLVGLKPTRARTPGFQLGAYSLGVGNTVTRTVRDTAAMLDCIRGPEVGGVYHVAPPERPYLDSMNHSRPLKIAFSTVSPSGSKVDDECVKGVERAAKLCEDLGHYVEEAVLPYEWGPFSEAFMDLWCYQHPYGVHLMEELSGRCSGPDTRETCNLVMLERAEKLTMFKFARSLRVMDQTCVDVGSFFNQYDVFISPVNTSPALKLGAINANAADLTDELWKERAMSNHSSFTPIFNVTGQPAISLPLYQSTNQLPVGIQFAAGHGDESTLLQLARQLELALPWSERKPPLSVF